MVRRNKHTGEDEELYLKKTLKLVFLKISFHCEIGCKDLNYQSSALTIPQQGSWKVSMFVFVCWVLSMELCPRNQSVPPSQMSFI